MVVLYSEGRKQSLRKDFILFNSVLPSKGRSERPFFVDYKYTFTEKRGKQEFLKF